VCILSAMRPYRLFAILLLTATAWCGDYQVVLKDTGKVIHGDFLYEDAHTITLQMGSVETSFKKDRLDLDRMRELNKASRVSPTGPTAELPPKEVGVTALRNLERQIPEREDALARLQAEPPSDQRDRKIREAEEELRIMRRTREDLKLEYGVTQDPELERLLKLRSEAYVEAEAAQRAYDTLSPDATQAEAEAKWQAFQAAEKKWQDAQEALKEAMERRR